MLPKFVASWLIVLVVVPFTAPFSTCDLAAFFGSGQARHTPFAPPRSTAITKDVAVPSVPGLSTSGRVRLMPLSGVAVAQTKASSGSARLMRSGVSADSIKERAFLTTVLRV